ncbi:MAG: hypothetical protein L0228_04775 [Planctomycetes bacterium]|nr:hypothetical protein [Planctomycetota bacterium]
MTEVAPSRAVIKQLSAYFHRNGYVRRVDPVRRKVKGRLYKKGAEVRLVAESRAELAEIRRLLKRAGFKRARPFAKARQWRQPVYGVAEVARFLSLVGKPKRRRKRR